MSMQQVCYSVMLGLLGVVVLAGLFPELEQLGGRGQHT